MARESKRLRKVTEGSTSSSSAHPLPVDEDYPVDPVPRDQILPANSVVQAHLNRKEGYRRVAERRAAHFARAQPNSTPTG